MKKILGALAALLFATAALADTPFNTFVGGLSAPTTPTGAEQFPCVQGGSTKQCTLTIVDGYINTLLARSPPPRTPKPPVTALSRGEIAHHVELHLQDRDDDQLRDSLAGRDGERRRAAVPAGDHERSLVVRIDEADEIAEHDAVLVPQSRTRQQHRGGLD